MNAPALPKRYSVASLLGEGGQGRVYRVRDSLRDRDLALKLVSADDAEFLRREFDTLRQIRHENLIQVFDWGTLESGEAFYTMELVEGEDWGHRMGAAQPADEVRRILTGLLRGLAHLHCHGEIHGDLKPGNILLGQGGVVKVTDVGMAGSVKGGIAGTPGYTAPECWEGKPADIRADLYSVGVMAYEALTGKHPFGGRTIREVVAGQIEGWVASPGAHGVRVPSDLERTTMRALERKAPLRPASADEFMEEVGVKDRVGAILGGKFVGRERELQDILGLIRSEDPNAPTMFAVLGVPGSGRETLLHEVAYQLTAEGVASLTWEEWESQRGVEVAGRGPNRRCVFVGGSGSLEQDRQETALRDARKSQADAITDGCSSRVVFLSGSAASPPTADPCVHILELSPIAEEDVVRYVEGIIGKTSIPTPLVARMKAITGGHPGSLTTAVRSLVSSGLLARRAAVWHFNEAVEIREIAIPEIASPWKARYRELRTDERELLLAAALAERRLTLSDIESLSFHLGEIVSLEARGYLQGHGQAWSLASEGMRDGLLAAADASEVHASVRRLLSGAVLTSERRTDMLLMLHSPDALNLAVDAARAASGRGEHYRAIERFRRCRDLAESNCEGAIVVECALGEAEVLNLLGRFGEAATLLQNLASPVLGWKDESTRSFLLGIAQRGAGEIVAAASSFERARMIQDENGEHEGSLWSLCELAGMRWQFGTPDDRKSIVAELRGELRSEVRISVDLRAALSYQLGGALLEIGELDEAKSVLYSAAGLECSHFWRMRIRIALGTAEHRSGRSDAALRWLSEAWDECEKGGSDAYRPRIMTNRGATLYQRGEFRRAMDANTQGLNWARRVGNLAELMFAACGTSGCATILGEYEVAIRDADEALRLAARFDDPLSLEKAMELKLWVHYWLGEFEECEELGRETIERFSGVRASETRARVLWVFGRLLIEKREFEEAGKWLEEALSLVRQSADPEDLPGIEIEVLRFKQSRRANVDSSTLISRIRSLVEVHRIPTAVTLGAIAVGEILMQLPSAFEAEREFLLQGLAVAESSDIAEASWRINYYLGLLSRSAGDDRTARMRFGAALKGLRRIADRLQPQRRLRYLSSSHVRPLLDSLSGPRAEAMN